MADRSLIGRLKTTVIFTAREAALHEVDEWVRYDGKPLHDPHFEKIHRNV